jgi:hypothetical protein
MPGAGPRFRHRGRAGADLPRRRAGVWATSWASRWRPLAVCGWYSPWPKNRSCPREKARAWTSRLPCGPRCPHGCECRQVSTEPAFEVPAFALGQGHGRPVCSGGQGEWDDVDGACPERAAAQDGGAAGTGRTGRSGVSASRAFQRQRRRVADQCVGNRVGLLSAGSLAAPIRGRFVSSREGSALVSMSYFLTSPPAPSGSVRGRKGLEQIHGDEHAGAGRRCGAACRGTDFMTVAV